MLDLIRHGRTEANARRVLLGRTDPDLDETGRQQAEAIARALRHRPIRRILCSPLLRCRSTAAAFGRPYEIDERLIELDYGALEGVAIADVPAAAWVGWRDDFDFAPEGGESVRSLSTRVTSLLDELAGQVEDHDVVVVSHVTPIKAAIAWALGVEASIHTRLFVSQASISQLAVSGGRPVLHSFDDVSHLSEIAVEPGIRPKSSGS